MPDPIGRKPAVTAAVTPGLTPRPAVKPVTVGPDGFGGAAKTSVAGEGGVPVATAGGLKPTSTTSVSATFDFGGTGKMMRPGDEMRLELPDFMRKRAVRSVMLSHRQDAATDTGENAVTPGRD